jgi:penicillin-binding protein 1C
MKHRKRLRNPNKTTVSHVCHSERSEESRSLSWMETLRAACPRAKRRTQGDIPEVFFKCFIRILKKTVKALAILTALSLIALAVAWHMFPFPHHQLTRWRSSAVVSDINNRPMVQIVSSQEQWCIPVKLEKISPWLIQATIAVEDERFYSHPGVDPIAAARAAAQNLSQRRIVSGASTLTMQVCRMMQDRSRNFKSKMIESFRAIQLDYHLSKDQILEHYLNQAPYGGNIRGVEAAAQIYFNKPAEQLSLAEAALLAGIPKSPSRFDPRRREQKALQRKNFVLERMQSTGVISSEQMREAQNIPIAICSHSSFPPRARHAAWLALRHRPQGGKTCIDLDIQNELERLAQNHLDCLPPDSELAVVVIDIAQSAIVALIGSGDINDPVDGQVNGVVARRSPGSALKPFIYAAAFDASRLAPESILYDKPINLSGWSPSNFDRKFSGPVSAAQALRQSLNIPALQVAKGIGLARCCGVIESLGINLPAYTQSHIGLALPVGGVEVSLLELTNAYAAFGREGKFTPAHLFPDESTDPAKVFNPNVCAAVNDILSSRQRRPAGMENSSPEEIPWFMWKTGTSSARRDAWAVGHNMHFAIGVWVGRFRGTGRLEYVGAIAAEPLLAELFDLPQLRNIASPKPAAPLIVKKPLPLQPVHREKLRIINPQNGHIYIALNERTPIHPSANSNRKLLWFLNGKMIADAKNILISPGSYTLLCLSAQGKSDQITFTVR